MSGVSLTQPFGIGHGDQQVIAGTTPAAGASFTFSNQGFWFSRLIACVFTLVTDANVAERYVTVQLQDSGGTAFCVNGAGVTLSASSTQRYCGDIERSAGEWATGTDIFFPLAPLFLEEGNLVKINVGSIQAGDQLSAIRLVLDRFPTSLENQAELAGP